MISSVSINTEIYKYSMDSNSSVFFVFRSHQHSTEYQILKLECLIA